MTGTDGRRCPRMPGVLGLARIETGLLTALDFYKRSQSGIEGKSIEVEYRLHSRGELYPSFIGNREHSIEEHAEEALRLRGVKYLPHVLKMV